MGWFSELHVTPTTLCDSSSAVPVPSQRVRAQENVHADKLFESTCAVRTAVFGDGGVLHAVDGVLEEARVRLVGAAGRDPQELHSDFEELEKHHHHHQMPRGKWKIKLTGMP
jgi:hypothetical protein